jgi:hypothetical protein
MTDMNGAGAKCFLLWFMRERTEGEDIGLLIGVYETEAKSGQETIMELAVR